jgi:thioester reductase-like protein
MPARRDILLTGATGFLGRYALRDLAARGRRVVVLARGAPESAAERIAALWDGLLVGHGAAHPAVVCGDLLAPRLGLDAADRRRIGRCGAVLHAAADVHFHDCADGGPSETNAEGTARLVELCRDIGISEFHHVSTAFVCGDRAGTVREDELECGQAFHNDYERSKFQAERCVLTARGLLPTIYRPSVIVGDSRTGYTSSYHGLYPFLELADRVAETAGPASSRRLALRLPFTGEEPRDLVPVDWVAQAIVRLMHQPRRHGRTFHLTSARPIRMDEIKRAAEAELGLEGARWVGGAALDHPTTLERLFRDHVRDYWPYLHGDPVFDRRNIRAALPSLPPPLVDHVMLGRLIRFARADQWGRRQGPPAGAPAPRRGGNGAATDLDCADYVERFLPAAARRSLLVRAAGLNLTIGLDVSGPGGGCWSCRWDGGDLTQVRRGEAHGAAVAYRTDASTFAAVVRGRTTAREAFFARRIGVEGDVEKALKLAVIFERFVKENPYRPGPLQEATDADACPR